MGWKSSIAQVGSSLGKKATPEEVRPWPRTAPTVSRNDGLVKIKSRIFCHLIRNVFRAFLPRDAHVGLPNSKPRQKVKICVTKLHETPKYLIQILPPTKLTDLLGKMMWATLPSHLGQTILYDYIHNKQDSDIFLG